MVKLHGKPNEGNAIFLEFSAHILIGKWEVSKCIKAYTSAYIKRDLIQASLKFSLKGWSFTSTWSKWYGLSTREAWLNLVDLTKYRNVLDPSSMSAYDLVIEAYWFEALETLGKLNPDTEILVEKSGKNGCLCTQLQDTVSSLNPRAIFPTISHTHISSSLYDKKGLSQLRWQLQLHQLRYRASEAKLAAWSTPKTIEVSFTLKLRVGLDGLSKCNFVLKWLIPLYSKPFCTKVLRKRSASEWKGVWSIRVLPGNTEI